MINTCLKFISRIPTIIKIACIVLLLFAIRMSYLSCAADTTDQTLFNFNQDIALTRDALKAGAAVDSRKMDDDTTPLMAAVLAGDLARTQLFIDYGADVNARTRKLDGRSVLYIAVANFDNAFARSNFNRADSFNILSLLITSGANMRGPQDNLGNAILHAAIRTTDYENRMPLFGLLMEHGADINAQNKNGDTVLNIAIENNNIPWVELVRTQFGSLINLRLRNRQGFFPIEYANYLHFVDIVYILEKPFPVLGLQGDVNAYDSNGLTPLMLAVIDNNKDLVNRLVKDRLARIDLRSSDAFNYSILHLALFQQALDMASLLISLGANVEQRDSTGRTALLGIPWMQTLQNRKKALEIILKAGANINAQDNRGNGLLYYLILQNDLPFFKYILQTYGNKVQVELKNNNSEAPIDVARRLRRWEFVKALGGSQ